MKSHVMITPFSACSLGTQLAAFATAAPSSQTVVGAANRAIFIPFTLDESTTFVKGFWYNGATVSGNVDIGIYDESGTRQVSIGSTAQATINVIQEVNIADTTLAAGRYYMAIALNNTTGTMFCVAPGIQYAKGLGMAQQASAFPLPATATFATPAQSVFPFFGFSTRTLIV